MEREKSSSLDKHTGFRSVQAKRNGKRRAMMLLQVCLISGTLGVSWAMSILLTCTGTVPKRYVPDATDLPGRRLMAVDNNTLDRNCTEPAIHNFPLDIFTNTQRTNGAVVLHIFAALYMFFALAVVCDDYFVPSLEKICENLHLTEDVAGATFMAAGSSAPELFASIIGVFITHGDVGVGTIVGSAVFNVLCIIGVCGIFAGQVVCLSKYPLFRDTLCYILSVVALIMFIYDGKIVWWESGILVVMYAGYILIMKFNSSIQNHLLGKEKRANSQTAYSELEDSNDFNSNCWDDPTKPLLGSSPPVKSTRSYTHSSAGPEDQIRSPVHYNFPEAGLRIMITKHFRPKTRLCMASRLIIHERIMHSSNFVAVTMATVDKREIWANGGSLLEPTAEEGGDGGVNSPFSAPGGFMERAKWLLSWPILFLLYLTVPDCSQLRWEKYFLLSFVLATIWIAVFSYIMVWMVTVVGFTLGIPDVIMGITFLAAGTSVPDCMASLIVARQGLGDMAVSNSIGSNVFDILVGLGVPWVIQTLAVDLGSEVLINSRGLVYSVVLLLGSVTLTVLAIHFNGWRLDVRLGVFVILLYAVFLCFSVLIEYNVFTFVNLPMCLEL